MKKANKIVAQGDMLLIKVEEIPSSAAEQKPEGGRHILAHSETGHHHWVEDDVATLFRVDDEMICYLQVDGEADIVHARNYDTHETLKLPKGNWQIRRQREYTPAGWRRVED